MVIVYSDDLGLPGPRLMAISNHKALDKIFGFSTKEGSNFILESFVSVHVCCCTTCPSASCVHASSTSSRRTMTFGDQAPRSRATVRPTQGLAFFLNNEQVWAKSPHRTELNFVPGFTDSGTSAKA